MTHSKKIINFLIFLFIFINPALFGESLKIEKVIYNIEGSNFPLSGRTSVYALEQKVKPDLTTIFEDEDSLNKYIDSYIQELNNLRAFENIDVSFLEIPQTQNDSDNSIKQITLLVNLKDSIHLLAVPYPKYDSNKGLNFKLKAKDMNFLGTLNPLSTDIFLILPFDSEDNNREFGINFSYDYPFQLFKYDTTWINDYAISFNMNQKTTEWNAKTGLKIEVPVKQNSLVFTFYQSSIKDVDYTIFNDELFFNENLIFSVPLTVGNINKVGKISYTPYLDLSINWDFNGINKLNTDLSSPVFKLGHSLSAGKINWNYNFREGLSFNLTNSFSYNLQRNILYPFISGELKWFNYIKLWEINFSDILGIGTRLYAFNYFVDKNNPFFNSDGQMIGERLRGIRDDQVYSNTNVKSTRTISAFVINLDLPINLFNTSFTHKFLNYFNFDLQISPFIDIALTHNKITGDYFSFKDGFYSGGIEILVYPKKWSSFTVRGSIGIDLGKVLLKDLLNSDWRADISPYEISFGIGLQY